MSLKQDYDELAVARDGSMIIVTATYKDERGGCLVGFHTQCSIEPIRHAIWLSKANHTCRVALQSTHLGVHFLGMDHLGLARLFGERTGDDLDKFQLCDTVAGHFDVPLLRDVPNRMVARRTAFMDDGSDHVCFMVEPLEVHRASPDAPLRLSDVSDLEPGHAAEERATET